ncbi:dynein regulatory complex subunit 3 [Pungitius pungitius]|uniref:dynein regulatory complex subunit 3 n=1 Tax=Pungitius pungitius TaxID=134920 RepID=UPI002E167EB7
MDKGIFMDEEILRKVIMEQAAQDRVECIFKTDGIHFKEIPKLRLEYRDIRMISHLWDFTSLSRLDLNNNLIEKIEGLDGLVNLTRLNLSFNKIEKIEGLWYLQKLELLNLSNNRISVIENMDTLEKLTHVFIANNLLGHLENVVYLRRFKNLFTVNLHGNPFSKKDDYKYYIAAYLPDLTCLDYRLLDEKTKTEASKKYCHVLGEIKRAELQMQRADEVEQSRAAEVKLHLDAFVEFLNGSSLFDCMLKDDPVAETLHRRPEVAHLLQTFERQMVALCMQLFETGLTEYKRRQMEVDSFFSGQNAAVTHYQQQASEIVASFEQQHKTRKAELQQLSEPDLLKVKINHCKEEKKQLCTSLMALEFELVRQQEDIIKKLDSNIADMIGNFNETAHGIFAQCRGLEDDFHKNLQVIVETLKNVDMDNRHGDMLDHDQMVYGDALMDALATSHENHLLKINERETQLITRADAWRATLTKGIEEKELRRSRLRISDIHRYADYLWEQLEDLHLAIHNETRTT